MATLKVTIIDVGWGDSILLEFQKQGNEPRFALIDCNDSTRLKSSFAYVKRYLQTAEVDWEARFPLFDFVLLTHGHDDHSRGLKAMIAEFRTDHFWYPKSDHPGVAQLLRFANRSTKVNRHQSVDDTKVLPDFGDVKLEVLWPPHNNAGPHDTNDENNNSVVLSLTLDTVTFVLTGDCQAENWSNITARLPATLKMFQVPHHAAENGLFDAHGDTPWLDAIANDVQLGMSCHISPHKHPHGDVVGELDNKGFTYFRTDKHYHVTFSTDGTNVETQWSRI